MDKTKIPEIHLSENQIVRATHEIPLGVDGKNEIVVVQKLSAGQRQEIVKATTKTKVVGTQVNADVDAVGYQIGLLSKVIVKAPFPHDEKTLKEFPSDVLDYLLDKYHEWAEPKKKD